MNDLDIRQAIMKLLKNIAPETEPEKLGPDQNIRQTLGIDSFDYLQFIIGLDEALGIHTPEEDYGRIETIGALLDYVRKSKHKAEI